ncbi:MAG: hypothetical protein GY696_05470 [Gammaproteobacteria bacterium]|nr:hypothetical protein [Gammaproteobacteria bacterium]
MYVPVVIDEDPVCDCDCVLGSLGMTMLGFKILTPQGDVDLLSYNRSNSRVLELRQEFPEFWPAEGTDGLAWWGGVTGSTGLLWRGLKRYLA